VSDHLILTREMKGISRGEQSRSSFLKAPVAVGFFKTTDGRMLYGSINR